jgi:hypothetical protein
MRKKQPQPKDQGVRFTKNDIKQIKAMRDHFEGLLGLRFASNGDALMWVVRNSRQIKLVKPDEYLHT